VTSPSIVLLTEKEHSEQSDICIVEIKQSSCFRGSISGNFATAPTTAVVVGTSALESRQLRGCGSRSGTGCLPYIA